MQISENFGNDFDPTRVFYHQYIHHERPEITVYTQRGNAIRKNKLLKLYNYLRKPLMIVKKYPDTFDPDVFDRIDLLCDRTCIKMFDYITGEVKWNVPIVPVTPIKVSSGAVVILERPLKGSIAGPKCK